MTVVRCSSVFDLKEKTRDKWLEPLTKNSFTLPSTGSWGFALKFLPNGLFLIHSVVYGGQGALAGIQTGDYLICIGGDDLHEGDLTQAMNFIAKHKKNSKNGVIVDVMRVDKSKRTL